MKAMHYIKWLNRVRNQKLFSVSDIIIPVTVQNHHV